MKKIHCPIERVNPKDNYHYFFGYYDKCPWNKSETLALCHRAAFIDHFPLPKEYVEVGYIDCSTHEFHLIDKSSAWNWQQGTQLQWIIWKGKECAIYNVKNEERVYARIYDFETGEKMDLSNSIYSVSFDGKFASTVNYARLYDCRKDYGISGLVDLWYADNAPSEDGVFVTDLLADSTKLVVSTAELEATSKDCGYIHRFKQRENHVMFNPSGTRFCFMHRYFTNGNIQQSRLFTSDLEGKDVRLLFEGFVSHYDWKDDETILAWAGKRKLISSNNTQWSPMGIIKHCLKPIYYALGKPRILMQKVMRDSFYLIKDVEKEGNCERIGMGVLYCDGHCTYSPDKRWILTDGYTDKNNKLPLFLFDTETSCLYEIGRYDTPKELDGELRIDLHPRFNHDGTKVFIDSGMNGKRDMYIVDVSSIVGKF